MKQIITGNTMRGKLDLTEGWKQVTQEDVESLINNKDKGNYWWFSKDKKRVTTIKNGKISHYKTDDVDISFIESSRNVPYLGEKSSEILETLSLSPDNKVQNTAEAYEKAKYSNKTVFWFISKGKKKAVVMLDFSCGKKPKVTTYPLDKYELKMKPVNV